MIITSKAVYITIIAGATFLLGLVLAVYNQINQAPIANLGVHQRSNSPPFPGGTDDNLFWFIQVSDIHLSLFYDSKRQTDLQVFCSQYVDVIKPRVVLVTGDITDAKHKNKLGSNQFEDEWKMYWNTLQKTGVLSKTMWLDVRGNHDSFNVINHESKENYFKTYSVQGQKHRSSYTTVLNTDFGKYCFSAIDSCPNPGPRRPFNFFGTLSTDQLHEIDNVHDASNNMTIFFGHYPTSTIVNPAPGIVHSIRKGAVYLCGHLHTLLNYVPKIYTMHKYGNLELELGDWKDNRIFRILAVDHDMISFTDESFESWPIILITNPKHAQFVMTHHEPSLRMKYSTHIRVLVYSMDDIVDVDVEIDNKFMGKATHVNGPLFVLPWKPQLYSSGLHEIKVSVKDSASRKRSVVQPFTLDNTPSLLSAYKRFVLMLDFITTVKVLFFTTVLTQLLFLVVLRYCCGNIRLNSSNCHCLLVPVKALFRWLQFVSQSDKRIFWVVVSYDCYIAAGPWFIGEVLTDHVGYVFVHGLYVNGSYIPGSLTYIYGLAQLLQVNIPFTLYIGHCLLLVHQRDKFGKTFDNTLVQYLRNHWLFIALVTWQAYLAYTVFYLSYGAMAFFLGPMRTWSVFLFIVIRRWALTSTENADTENS